MRICIQSIHRNKQIIKRPKLHVSRWRNNTLWLLTFIFIFQLITCVFDVGICTWPFNMDSRNWVMSSVIVISTLFCFKLLFFNIFYNPWFYPLLVCPLTIHNSAHTSPGVCSPTPNWPDLSTPCCLNSLASFLTESRPHSPLLYVCWGFHVSWWNCLGKIRKCDLNWRVCGTGRWVLRFQKPTSFPVKPLHMSFLWIRYELSGIAPALCLPACFASHCSHGL